MLSKQAQTDFSAGMFRGSDAELIPPNGALDIVGLLTPEGSVSQRGPVGNYSTATVDALYGIWSGALATTGRINVLFTGANVVKLNDDGSTTVVSASVPALARPAVYNGVLFWDRADYDGTTVGSSAPLTGAHYAVVAGRLIRAVDTSTGIKVAFTGFGTTTFGATDFHLIPGGGTLRGIYPLRDSLAVFTSKAVYVIGGLNMNLTDAAGNVQQRIDLYSDDVVLAGSSWGIVGYEGGLVVPTEDGVWTVSLGITSEVPLPLWKITRGIDGLFLSKEVAYLGGQAWIHHDYYLLPLFTSEPGGWVLVCKLDSVSSRGRRAWRIYPWSRLTGYGGDVRAIGEVIDSTGGKNLVCGARPTGRKLLSCGWFSSTAGADPDAVVPAASVITRDIATGAMTPNMVVKVRVGYTLGTGTVTASASGTKGDHAQATIGHPLTPLAGSGDQTTETKAFPVRIKSKFSRVQVVAGSSSGPVATIRSIELFTRASGAQ